MDLINELSKLSLVTNGSYLQQLQDLVHRQPSICRAVLHQLAKANHPLAYTIATHQVDLEHLLRTGADDAATSDQPPYDCIDIFWPEGLRHGTPIAIRVEDVMNKKSEEFDRECFEAFQLDPAKISTDWPQVSEIPEMQMYFDRINRGASASSFSNGVDDATADDDDDDDVTMLELDDEKEPSNEESNTYEELVETLTPEDDPLTWQLKVTYKEASEAMDLMASQLEGVGVRGTVPLQRSKRIEGMAGTSNQRAQR